MTETSDAPTAYEADQELSDLTHAHHANVVLPGLEQEEELAPFTGHPASDEDISRGIRSADEGEAGDLD